MRKIIIEIETDSEESIGTLKNDLETEISCCWNSFDAESMKVFEAIGTNEEAIRELENESCYECTWGCESPIKCTCPKCSLKDATQKAIEALRERPHGEWICEGAMADYTNVLVFRCSVCEEHFVGHAEDKETRHFCPNCGSDNRKKGET